MALARWSFPLPDSPRRSRLTSWPATFSTVSRSVRMAALFVRTKSLSRGSRRFSGIARCCTVPAPGKAQSCLRGESFRYVRRVSPEPLQPVEPPRVLGEDVHDEVTIVEEHPATGIGSLDQERLDPVVLSQLLLDGIRNRRRLSLSTGPAEDEVVGDRRELADGEDVEIKRLLVQGRANRGPDPFLDGICHV